MGITELRQLLAPPMSVEEQELFERAQEKLNLQLEQINRDRSEYLRRQGIGMVEHLQQFIRGEESKFVRYFALVDPVHEALHTAFWNETRTRFPILTETQHRDDPSLAQIEFSELGAGLIARKDFDIEGNAFGIHYEGYITPNQPREVIGKLATGLAMS